MFDRFDADLRRVVRATNALARAWHTPVMGTAHLAAAVIDLGLSPASWQAACSVLSDEAVQAFRVSAGPAIGAGARQPFSDDAVDALTLAFFYARARDNDMIGPADVFMAALRVTGGARTVARALASDLICEPDLPPRHAQSLLAKRERVLEVTRHVHGGAAGEVAAPPARVWDEVYRPDSLINTRGGKVNITVLPGPRGLGERRQSVAVDAPNRTVDSYEITEFDPPHRLTDEHVYDGGGRLRTTVQVEPSATGSLVTLTVDWDVPELVALILEARHGDLTRYLATEAGEAYSHLSAGTA